MPYKDKSAYHTNPEEALSIARDLKSKKAIGMHWGTFVLSLEPVSYTHLTLPTKA